MGIYSFEQLGAGRQSQAEERKETGLSSFLAPKLASRLFSRVIYTNYKAKIRAVPGSGGEQCLCRLPVQQCNGQCPVKYKILAVKVANRHICSILGKSRRQEPNQMNEAVTRAMA